MSSAKKQNVGHSVFQRILAYAKANGEDFNLLLFRYGVERLVYRLSTSSCAFRKDTQKQTQWRAFVRKSKPDMIAGDLDAVVGDVAAFLRPVIEALLDNSSFELVWVQGGPWGGSGQ